MEVLPENVILLIASNLDDTVMEVINKTPLWEVISSQLQSETYQHFWCMRVQSLVNFDVDCSEAGDWRWTYGLLVAAIARGKFVSVVRGDHEYNDLALRLLLRIGYRSNKFIPEAVEHKSIKSLQLLLSYPDIDPYYLGRDEAIMIAARRGDLSMLELLLSSTRAGQEQQRDASVEAAMKIAAFTSRLNVLKFLEERSNVKIEGILASELLVEAARSNRVNVDLIKDLLSRKGIDLNYKQRTALNTCILSGESECILLFLKNNDLVMTERAIYLLMQDGQRLSNEAFFGLIRRAWPLDDKQVSAALSTALSKNNYDLIDFLIQEVEVSLLSSTNLESIVDKKIPEMEDRIRRSSNLSELSIEEIKDIISKKYESFSENSFEMLLQILILKHQSYSYYLDWLIIQLQDENTSQKIRDLISDAAGSILSSDPIVHDSHLFTAFSGFFLLANSEENDGRAVMNTLEDEGASKIGLQLAGALLGPLSRE